MASDPFNIAFFCGNDTDIYAAFQVYPWFNYYFLLLLGMVTSLKQNKTKIKQRIKLSHNKYIDDYFYLHAYQQQYFNGFTSLGSFQVQLKQFMS